MNQIQFKKLVLESLQQALKEISATSKSADLAALDAQIKALQLKIVSTQKQIAELNKQKALKAAEKITTESVSKFPKITNQLKSGKGDKLTAKDVNQNQLKKGIKIEMEHTNDREKAEEIALDHLSENPKYYTDLEKLEAKEKIGENTMKLKDFYFDEKTIIKETGEMSRDSIKPGGEYYDWAKYIKLNVLGLAKLSKGKVRFISMKPFDKYRGPYALVLINGKYDTIWGLEEKLLFIETLRLAGTIRDLAKAINGDAESKLRAEKLAKQLSENKQYKKQIIKEDTSKKDEKVPEVKYNFEDIDQVNYFELQRGMRAEINKDKQIDINKAKEIALQNLLKDPVYYTNLDDELTREKLSHGNKNNSLFIKIDDELKEFTNNDIEEQQVKKIEDMNVEFFKFKDEPKEKVKQLKETIKQIVKEILIESYNFDYIHPYNLSKKYKNTNSVNESRLNPEDADYEVKGKQNEKIYAFLKKKKAEIFTKLIKSLEALDKAKADIDEQKRILTVLQNEKKTEYEEQDDKLRQMVLDLFDAEETVNTLYVEANGALLTLAKKTDKNVDSIERVENTDYKKAWEALHEIVSAKDVGLVDQMNELVKQFTTVTNVEKKAAKRKLSRDVKLETILREFKISDIWNNFKSYIKKFKSWTKTFSKKLDLTKQMIDKL